MSHLKSKVFEVAFVEKKLKRVIQHCGWCGIGGHKSSNCAARRRAVAERLVKGLKGPGTKPLHNV